MTTIGIQSASLGVVVELLCIFFLFHGFHVVQCVYG